MTTNNKIMQKATPIIAPMMIPRGMPSLSLPLCISAATVADIVDIILLAGTGVDVTDTAIPMLL